MAPAERGRTHPDNERHKPPQPRGPDGRFVPVHGGYAGRRALRRPDRRRSIVRLAEELRELYAIAKGYPSWQAAPAPVAALIEVAVELRLFRRRLFSPFWSREEVPKRYDAIAELERRVLVSLGLEPERAATTLEDYVRKKYGGEA